jgi:hypothetical protein
MKTMWLACVLVAAAFRQATGQDIPAGIDAQATVQLERIVQDARAQGLPAERILAKVHRGVNTKVPSARIVTAAQAVAVRLVQARDALAPAPTEADILAGEDALSFGISMAVLRTVRLASPDRPVAVPLGVLTQLVANHVSPERATSIVIDLMRRGIPDVQLSQFIRDVNQDVALGGAPDKSVDIRWRGLVPQIGPPGSFGIGSGDKVTVPAATTTPGPPGTGQPAPKPPPKKKP